jgi:hypothetical protein
MLILGFGNKARQGKDTAAEAIRQFYENQNTLLHAHGLKGGLKVGTFKFATALYQEVNGFLAAFNGKDNWVNATHDGVQIPAWVTPEPNAEISALAPYGKRPKLLQFWGTEFRRAQDPDYWTKKLFASIPANLDIAIVTDVRFQNEADGIRQRGGYNVNVTRLRDDRTQYFSSDRPVDHPSETALDGYKWDFTLLNFDGHQALLGEQAVTLAEYLRGLNG